MWANGGQIGGKETLQFLGFWLSFISIVLLIIPFASLSHNPGVIKDTSWTVAKASSSSSDITVKQYVGLRLVVVTCDGDLCPEQQDHFKWTDADCVEDFCDECLDATDGTITAAVVGLITMFPQITTNLQRSSPAGDLHCQKFMGMLTSLLGFVGGIISLYSYQSGCYTNLPSTINGYDVTYHLGPSYYCMLFATMFKPVDFLINLVIPVPAQGYWKQPEEENALNSTFIDTNSKY
eukprot:CAMPEP_0114468278 /NCGR_PEP_ID=MMETSP0104-20121206/10093_1 /TAXON_ID=37642 ORGANISM="Paraphysomonas imperforata, Strain PA2" /NCGR_SAMPLE_ID=MMETSP0104 /ASSEMBLY_ACC=CAM_ASM_000202 /LENGTH=235 /DNA_ID=CAMNT_0001641845 /DNA_START=121 /DNA_END=828 /DNA_ORIENTATION=+